MTESLKLGNKVIGLVDDDGEHLKMSNPRGINTLGELLKVRQKEYGDCCFIFENRPFVEVPIDGMVINSERRVEENLKED
jgi:hypothetical protein